MKHRPTVIQHRINFTIAFDFIVRFIFISLKVPHKYRFMGIILLQNMYLVYCSFKILNRSLKGMEGVWWWWGARNSNLRRRLYMYTRELAETADVHFSGTVT